MSVKRLEHIPGFGIDRVAAAAGDDPDVLRLENLDTDIPPPAEAVEATRAAVGTDDANSWLPFRTGFKSGVGGRGARSEWEWIPSRRSGWNLFERRDPLPRSPCDRSAL